MKKKHVNNLTLSKKTISNLMTSELIGGRVNMSHIVLCVSRDLIEQTTINVCTDTIGKD